MELSVQSFDKICRACLKESGDMKSLFIKFLSGHRLLDLLKTTVNVDVSPEDGLPKQICGDCEAFIHKVNEFKRRCLESEEILKNLCGSTYTQNSEDSVTKICENKVSTDIKMFIEEENLEQRALISVFPKSEISIRKIKSSDADIKVKEEIQNEYESHDDFVNTEQLDIIPECNLEEPETKMDNENGPKHKCSCGQEFYTLSNYQHHLKILNCNKYKKLQEGDTKTFITIINDMPCLKCDLKFTDIMLWSEHARTHVVDEPGIECSICSRKFKNEKTLSRHSKRHMLNDNIKHTCTKCKQVFKYKALLECHMLSVHKQDSSSSNICDE